MGWHLGLKVAPSPSPAIEGEMTTFDVHCFGRLRVERDGTICLLKATFKQYRSSHSGPDDLELLNQVSAGIVAGNGLQNHGPSLYPEMH